jgi:hypothetical protein
MDKKNQVPAAPFGWAHRRVTQMFLGRLIVGTFAIWLAGLCPGLADECAGDPLPCVVRVLAQEKSNSEEMARLLHTYARGKASKEAQGIKLYASARGAFNGLIEELKSDVDRAQSPGVSDELNRAVRSAVDKSRAFASYVDGVIPHDGRTKGLIDIAEILKGSAELFKSLVDGGLAIWDKFHERDKEQKDRLREQLDQLRWKSFAEATS